MFMLSVCFGPNGTIWGLAFKTREAADVAAHGLRDEKVVSDDYGQELCIPKGQMHGILLEDLDQTQIVQEERSLRDLRMRGKIAQRAGADPAIRSALAMTQGPAMINPMGNGRFS